MTVPRFATLMGMLVLAWMSIEARAQYRFRHLTTKDGLIQGSVYYFLEDRQGLMWMTTQAGLNRFDGQRFRSFVHDETDTTTISKGEVRGLAEAPNGDIWMGTEVALSRYSRKTDRFQHYYVNDSLGRRQFAQHMVLYANDSTVWYLNDHEGLVQMNYRTGRRKVHYAEAHYRHEFRTDVAHFDALRQVAWLVQPHGLVRYDARSGKATYFFTGRQDDVFADKRIVYGLFSNEPDKVWLSTDKGLVELTNRQYRSHQVGIDMAQDLVFSMAMAPDGRLWMTSSHSGLIRYDPRRRRVEQRVAHDPFQANTLLGNYLSKVFFDSRGILWANTEPKGINLVFPDSLALGKFEDNLLNPDDFNLLSIRGISQDRRGNLWVGSSGEGVRKVTPEGRIQRYGPESGFLNAAVRGITTDQTGTLWISTASGLMKVPHGSNRAVVVPIEGTDLARTNYLKGVLEAGPGEYLLATMGGLFRHNQLRTRLLTDFGEGYSGAMYYHKPTGQLWVGRSEKDLRCYALRSDTLLPLYDRLSGYSILSIVPDPSVSKRLVLWLGTDNGLVQFDATENKILRTYTTRDGLPDRVVYSTVFDEKGGIWISTNKGLARLDKEGKFQRIRQSEGVEFNSFAAWKAQNGKLYFGGTQGLFYLQPEALTRPSSRGLKVLSLRIHDSTYYSLPDRAGKRPLELQHTQNDLTFELAALDYLSDTPPVYEYRLNSDSEDDGWISNGSYPVVRFQNLTPGTYRVTFRALDANGIYTEEQSIEFLIHYPYWQRWWFVALLVVAGMLALFGLVRIYVTRQQAAHQKLTSRVISALESERQRIAMDIHDDVNNTLAAAKGYLQPGLDEKTALVPSQRIDRSRELIQKATEDLRAITHDLMAVQFEGQELPGLMAQKVQEWDTSGTIRFTFIMGGQYVKLHTDAELMIYRIICELVQNIRKHARTDSAIIQLIYQKTSLVVSVEDNGIGMDHSIKSKKELSGIGLKNIYSRAEYLKADLQIHSDEQGVLIHLTIPYGPNRPHPGSSGR
jgi:signal transduction histidine kinase/ligand-binding sensor domain-containing protein